MPAESTNENTTANMKRALLIKNAYLGLEKVENCHKVKSERMKDQCMLRSLVRQVDRDRYIVSLHTYRAQQKLKMRLNNMVKQTELDLARASGEKDNLRIMLADVNRRKSQVNLAGPSAVEDNLFKQILQCRRESLASMRKPENYDLRLSKKGFWEEDEEFYKTFDGAINNPFQLIDDMMAQSGDQSQAVVSPSERQGWQQYGKTKRMKSLSAVEKISFTKQISMDMPRVASRSRGKSAITQSIPFDQLLISHKETSEEKSKELDARRDRLYKDLNPLLINDVNSSKITKALERYEDSTRHTKVKSSSADTITRLPRLIASLDPSVSIRSKTELRNVFMSSSVPSLTWKAIK